MAAYPEYPSSTEPRPYSRPLRTTGVHGPSPSDQPWSGGCLSRCPYSSTVSSGAPSAGGMSISSRGERPSSRTTSASAPGMPRAVTHCRTWSTAASRCPLASQSAAYAGGSAGMPTSAVGLGRTDSSQACCTVFVTAARSSPRLYACCGGAGCALRGLLRTGGAGGDDHGGGQHRVEVDDG